MTIVGKVIKTEGEFATVSVYRPTSCGENCAMCKGCGGSAEKTTVALNPIHASPGNMVRLEMGDRYVLAAAFFVYILPLILGFSGMILSDSITKNDTISIWTGTLSFLVSFAVIFNIDKKLQKSGKYYSKIVKIISDESEKI